MPWQNSADQVVVNVCKSDSKKYILLKELWFNLATMSEEKVHEETGCKAMCKRREWKTNLMFDMNTPTQPNASELELRLFFANGRYQVKKEYYKYSFSSLVSDSGGLMGLLLGSSFLSCFDLACRFFTKKQGKQ